MIHKLKPIAYELKERLEQHVMDCQLEQDTDVFLELNGNEYILDYSANIEIVEGCKSFDRDQPSDPDEIEISFNWIEIKEIYNKKGVQYFNVIEKLNKFIND